MHKLAHLHRGVQHIRGPFASIHVHMHAHASMYKISTLRWQVGGKMKNPDAMSGSTVRRRQSGRGCGRGGRLPFRWTRQGGLSQLIWTSISAKHSWSIHRHFNIEGRVVCSFSLKFMACFGGSQTCCTSSECRPCIESRFLSTPMII